MCDFYPDEMAAVFRSVYRQARKAHRCDSCKAAISPGERYLSSVTITRGERPDEGKVCGVCAAMWEDFKDSHSGYLAPPYLTDMLEGCVDRVRGYGFDISLNARLAFQRHLSEDEKKWRRYMAILVLRKHRNRNKELDR